MIDLKQYFSACLIVKDEEINLQRCINSLKKYCSQIVVVDTGSNDKTPNIASINSCDLFFYKWNKDFSEVRNNALQYALNPWIISIDADEVIEHIDVSEQILNDESIGGIEVEIKNYLSEKDISQTTTHSYSRIFRNHEQIRYQDKIHEQIRPSIEDLGLKIIRSRSKFLHYGYQKSDQEKKNRNQDLLKTQVNERGDDWDIFYLAESEFSLSNNDEAKKNYLIIIDSEILPAQQKDKTKIRLAQIYLSESDHSEVERLLDFRSTDSDLEGLRLFVLAASKLSTGNIVEAENLYKNSSIQDSNMIDLSVIDKAMKVIDQLKQNSDI